MAADRDDIRPLLETILDTISRQYNQPREFIPLEVEEVARRVLFEAHRKGQQLEKRRGRKRSVPFEPPTQD